MSDQNQEEDITPMAPDPDTEPGFGLIAEADEENINFRDGYCGFKFSCLFRCENR